MTKLGPSGNVTTQEIGKSYRSTGEGLDSSSDLNLSFGPAQWTTKVDVVVQFLTALGDRATAGYG